MKNEKYDVIVIGAGVGGPTAGAILAQKEGMKVLVLERSDHIGGRDLSFKMTDMDEDTYRKSIGKSACTWITKSEPEPRDLFTRGYLKDWSFEVGIHVLMITDRGRTNTCLSYLGKPLTLYPATSAGWWRNGILHRFERGSERGGNFPWMDDEARRETGKINSEMVRMDAKTAHSYDNISLKDWMEQRTRNPYTHEFHYVNATMNTTINSPEKISAGDNILMNRAVARSGYRFSYGGCSTLGSPGFVQIPRKYCEVIQENGGRIMTNAAVREVLVEGGKVIGVSVNMEGKDEIITCPIIINSGMVNEMFKYIPERHYPKIFVDRIKSFWRAGICAVYWGLSKPVVNEHLTFVAKIAGKEDGFDSDVRMGFWDSSGMCADRAPAGKQLLDAYVSMTDEESHNQKLVQIAYERMNRYMEDHYAGFKQNLEWALCTVSDSLVPVAQAPFQVGDSKPRAKDPYIEGLYHASDSSECSMAANDAAVHAGIIAATRVSGHDYIREILPEHLQD
jgi:protoporphyrinogen oxidase